MGGMAWRSGWTRSVIDTQHRAPKLSFQQPLHLPDRPLASLREEKNSIYEQISLMSCKFIDDIVLNLSIMCILKNLLGNLEGLQGTKGFSGIILEKHCPLRSVLNQFRG